MNSMMLLHVLVLDDDWDFNIYHFVHALGRIEKSSVEVNQVTLNICFQSFLLIDPEDHQKIRDNVLV